MATMDELDTRTRFLASEVEGEKAVTRHVLHQANLNADDLGTLKAEVRHLSEHMVVANAALSTQGMRLTLLTQDVTALRQDATVLRRDMEAVNARLDRQDSRLDAIGRRMEAMEGRMEGMEGRMATMERKMETMERDIAVMKQNIAAILAAVAPGRPPAS